MNIESRKRLMELAGIKTNKVPTVDRNPSELAADDYYRMNDEVQYDNIVQGFNKLLKTARESDEEVESIESINKRADMLYPGKKYYGMYAGERMMEESISFIDQIKDEDTIDLSSVIG